MIAISEVLTALESICNNVANIGTSVNRELEKVTASNTVTNDSSYDFFTIANSENASNLSSGSWICPDCGKANRSFDQTCSSCGANKS